MIPPIRTGLRPLVVFPAALLLFPGPLRSQNPAGAMHLVQEGIELHDKGKYKQAIAKYDKALALDKDNLTALYEKSFSLSEIGEYSESAALCQHAIEVHNGAAEAPMIYVQLGNCYDHLGKPEASLLTYRKGVTVRPDMHLLWFNMAVTLQGMDSTESALRALEHSARVEPFHPGTSSMMGRILKREGREVQAVMSFCRFFIAENGTDRAEENMAHFRQLISGTTATEDNGNVTLYVDADDLPEEGDTSRIENDFRSVETTWSVLVGLDMSSQILEALEQAGIKGDLETTSESDQLSSDLKALAGMLKEERARNFGFYWDYHADWMIALNDAGHVDALSNLIYAGGGDKSANKWLEAHPSALGEYIDWEKDYTSIHLRERRD